MQLRAMGVGFERVPTFNVSLTADQSQAVIDTAALKTPPGDYRIAFYGAAVAKHKPQPTANAADAKAAAAPKTSSILLFRTDHDSCTASREKRPQTVKTTCLSWPGSICTSSRRGFCKLVGWLRHSLPGILRLQRKTPARAKWFLQSREECWIMVCNRVVARIWKRTIRKPEATSDYRGPFRRFHEGARIAPGLLPRLGRDKFTVLRSMRQYAGGHPAGSMQLLSGDPDTRDKPKPRLPDWMSVTNYVRSQRGPRQSPLPAYVGINPPLEYNGRLTSATLTLRLSSRAIPICRLSRCRTSAFRMRMKFAA
jgi:hypothetical protein